MPLEQAQVRVTGDAAFGVPELAPFDLILVTVETTDVPVAWWDQLGIDGKIVAPVRFVPMQGVGEERERLVLLHDVAEQRVALRLDDDTPDNWLSHRPTAVTSKSPRCGTSLR
jgi:protein-L-isoaspartate O-methyltransferase